MSHNSDILKKPLNICLVTGEASGDVQASLLLKSLKNLLPKNAEFWGIGGPCLQNVGFKCIEDINNLAVMGASEVFAQYLNISSIYKKLLFEIEKRNPELIILVDYPACNLKLAEKLKHIGFKIVYYIPPKVWSHGISRVHKLKKYTDLVLSILPFEEQFFKSFGVSAKFVGNPLFDKVQSYLKQHNKNEFVKKRNPRNEKSDLAIGILPGSRKQEIERLLPLMIESFVKLNKKIPNTVAKIAIAQNLSKDYILSIFEQTCKKINISSSTLVQKVQFVENDTYSVMNCSDYAWVCSGTATLETGFFQTPMSVIYKVSALTAVIARLIIKVKYVSLVNLCLDKEVVPEFLQDQATVTNLVDHAVLMLTNSQKRSDMTENLKKLNSLFPENAAERAAIAITEMLIKGNAYEVQN